MSVLTELGVFDPNVDSVQIRGGFNGWNASQPEIVAPAGSCRSK